MFLDEINTSSCLGVLKEIVIDGTLNGEVLLYLATVNSKYTFDFFYRIFRVISS